MIVNNKKIIEKEFAYDGCHKIYIIEDKQDKEEAITIGYSILPIEKLKKTYKESCKLRFISNWKLTEFYARQFENAVIKSEGNE